MSQAGQPVGEAAQLVDVGHRRFMDFHHDLQVRHRVAQTFEGNEKDLAEHLLRMRVDEQLAALQALGEPADAVLAEGQAEVHLAVHAARQVEQLDRRLRQARVIGAPEQFVADDPARLGVDDRLDRARQAVAHDQLVELGLVRGEVLGQQPVLRHDHGMHLVEGQDAGLLDLDQAQPELGAGEVDDVAFLEQAVAFDPVAVDEGAVGAVLVDEAHLAGDVAGQRGMDAAQPQVGDHQVIFLAAADLARKPGDQELCATPVGTGRFERPLIIQETAPPPEMQKMSAD